MTDTQVQKIIFDIIENISEEIPKYKTSTADWSISNGHVAVCIIDDKGNIYGKIWGESKVKGRIYYDIAYRKASQVWITGYKTGEYEKLVFADKLDYTAFGIEPPDFMGWEGGQPIQLDPETVISCGFSGFRGVVDLDIVVKAVEKVVKRD